MPTRSLIEIVRRLAQHPEVFAGLTCHGYVSLLPLLEFPQSEVSGSLQQAFLDSGLSREDFESVSLRDLVVFALRSESDYWAGLAVHWLATGSRWTMSSFVPGDEMIAARRGTQKDRHTLFRLIRRYEPCA